VHVLLDEPSGFHYLDMIVVYSGLQFIAKW